MKYIDYLINELKLVNFEYDDVGIYSFTKPKDATIITKIINSHIMKIRKKMKKILITDATAGIGGNTISFASRCLRVNSIEIDPKRYDYLKHNCLNFNNIIFYNNNFLNVVKQLYQDVIFIDPPWGGKNYKKIKTIKISIDENSLDTICNKLFDCTKLIVLKLPINFDIKSLCNIKGSIYKYNLINMIIIVIETSLFKF